MYLDPQPLHFQRDMHKRIVIFISRKLRFAICIYQLLKQLLFSKLILLSVSDYFDVSYINVINAYLKLHAKIIRNHKF